MALVLPEPAYPLGTTARDYPIPVRQNFLLCLGAILGSIACLVLGSTSRGWFVLFMACVLFSHLMLLVYSLIHQAQHGVLHPDRRINHGLGVALSFLFPASFSMIRTTHQGHHLRNRTDYEMFDLYYASDFKPMKFAQFYSILIGLFWPIVPLGGVVAAISPRIFSLGPFRRALSTSYLLGDVRGEQAWAIRFEVLGNLLFFALLFRIFHLRWEAVAWMYAAFAFNWSTRQYVSHAFTKRDVTDGALNLRTNRWMSALLLHGEWDLNHHRYPTVPWIHLPRIAPTGEPRVSYWKQYLAQWGGPRPCVEAAPEERGQLSLSLWSSAEHGR